MNNKKLLTINEMSEKTGVNAQTLRNWEKNGLLKASETFGVHRLFNNEDIKHVKKIVNLREQGFQLQNIKSMLETPTNTNNTKRVSNPNKKTAKRVSKNIDYSEKSITELTDIAKKKGVKYFRQMNKAELVESLNNPNNMDKMITQAKNRTKERYGGKIYGKNKNKTTKKSMINLQSIQEIIDLSNSGLNANEIYNNIH